MVFAFRSSSFLPLPESVALLLDPTTSARIVFLLILLLFLLTLLHPRANRPSLVSPVSLLALLLSRPHNIPLVALHVLASQAASYVISISATSFHPLFVVFFFYSSSQLAFVSQGNSNSLASIDVSASTIGLTAHHPFLSGLLLTLATYSLPLLWLATLYEIGSQQEMENAQGAKKDNDLLEQVRCKSTITFGTASRKCRIHEYPAQKPLNSKTSRTDRLTDRYSDKVSRARD